MQIHLVQNSTSANFSQSQKLHYVCEDLVYVSAWLRTHKLSQSILLNDSP